MGTVEHGRILNKYNLSQRRKKGFMPVNQQFIKFNKRIGRASDSERKPPSPDAYELTKARKRELFRRGIPLLIGFVIFVMCIAYGVIWFLS